MVSFYLNIEYFCQGCVASTEQVGPDKQSLERVKTTRYLLLWWEVLARLFVATHKKMTDCELANKVLPLSRKQAIKRANVWTSIPVLTSQSHPMTVYKLNQRTKAPRSGSFVNYAMIWHLEWSWWPRKKRHTIFLYLVHNGDITDVPIARRRGMMRSTRFPNWTGEFEWISQKWRSSSR